MSVSPDSSLNFNNRAFTKTTVDGLGRPIKVESGGGSSTVNSITETEYDTCACSPTGKVKRVSLPYSGGGTVKWTAYTYDALGRTLTVSLPDGAGTTQYEYVKNTVKIIDAAQKWKKYETNGFGQLVKVYEPNPAGGADLVTTYTYNLRGQLATAVMTRDGVTQTRTFNYDLATGRLTSVTKPETGTTSYTYNTDGTVAHTIDAKYQKTAFTYDTLKRVTDVKRYTWNGSSHVHQSCQDVEYDYDSGTGSNLWGRVAKVRSGICNGVYVNAYEETFSYHSSGLLEYRDSLWDTITVPPADHVLRIQPTYNTMGLMTGYAYGNIGSLYSYTIGYDSTYRPISLTGEGLTLVDGVNYNAAGAMTAFTRRESGSVTVTNNYTFNTLYQMTNQTVARDGTPIQNLSYVFPTTNNNGQITQQIDHLASETVTYQYDALNRLISAETADTDWGLAWTYDGFGNRTNQTVTKGSGPTHSVSVDKNTNRINTTGYTYDFNGNMTQMPLLAMSYDVANRMIVSDHSSAGITYYGYNHANQRVYTRKDDGVDTLTYMLYGLGGERLMEMEEQCGGNCWDYEEKARWIYFAGRKMFQKTGSTLKAIAPNRLASEAKHFPYGETDGTPPSDTKDYFATYRRDGTGLDYAMNRYYSPAMGRFTTADPYGGSASPSVPATWNRYAYVSDNPVAYSDPTGLFLETYGGPGATWIICALDPFAAMSTNAGACGNSPYSEEMWSIMGPWDPIFAEPMPTPVFFAPQDAKPAHEWDKEIDGIYGVIADRFARSRRPGVPNFPLFLAVIEDCYRWHWNLPVWGRFRKYALLDYTGHRWEGEFKVQELITVTNGQLSPGSYPGIWSSPEYQFVEDFISRGSEVRLTEMQQFIYVTRRGRGSSFGWLPYIPLVIVEKSGNQHGTLVIDVVGSTVNINGDGGNVGRCN